MNKLIYLSFMLLLTFPVYAADVTVVWQRITEDTSTPPQPVTVTSYNIYVDGTLNSNFVPTQPTNTNQSVVVSGFVAGSTHTFGVSTVTAAGEGGIGEATLTIPTGIGKTPTVTVTVNQ